MAELFYVPPDRVTGNVVCFPRGESDHLRRSCRRGVGDEIQATDGEGRLMSVLITEAGPCVEGRVVRQERVSPEPLTIDLCVGMSKKERMNWLVEKGTEIGMTSLTPLITSWSRVRRHRNDWKGHLERWQRVAVSALKQSQRCYLPQINPPEPLERFLGRAQRTRHDLMLLLDRSSDCPALGELLEDRLRRFLIVVGPEGGFEEEEISRIVDAGFSRARLTDRPLRFETAGVSAMAVIAARSFHLGSRNLKGDSSP